MFWPKFSLIAWKPGWWIVSILPPLESWGGSKWLCPLKDLVLTIFNIFYRQNIQCFPTISYWGGIGKWIGPSRWLPWQYIQYSICIFFVFSMLNIFLQNIKFCQYWGEIGKRICRSRWLSWHQLAEAASLSQVFREYN